MKRDWKALKPFDHHGMVLTVGGMTYILTGFSLFFGDDLGRLRQTYLVVAANMFPLRIWALIFILGGVLASVSGRWPAFCTRPWGYMTLSGLASGWSAVYFLGWAFGKAPLTNINYAVLWGLMALLWWAVSGLVDPGELAMELIDLGAILVAAVAAFGAWAAQRAAAKASKQNITASGRLDAEKGAYERARAFDIQTIERQETEIKELRDANESLRRELWVVKARLARLKEAAPDLKDISDENLIALDDSE